MQSALAVLQFPLAAIPSATTDAVPPSQDFAISFSEDPSAHEGDISIADPGPFALDQPIVWTAPIVTVSGGLQAGLQDLAVTDGTHGELTGPQGAVTLPDEIELSSPASTAGSVDAENTSNAIDYPPGGPKADGAPASVDEGPYVPDAAFRDPAQPGSRLTAEPRDTRPDVASLGDQPASRAQGTVAADPAPEPAIAWDARGAKLAAMLPAQAAAQASAVETVRATTDAQPRQFSSVAAGPGKRMIEALPVDPVGLAAVHSDMATTTDDVAPTRLTDGEITLPQGPEVRTLSKPAGVEAIDASVTTDAPTTGTKYSAPEPPVTGSFWERYFTNRSDPQPATGATPDKLAQTPVEQVLAAIGIAPRLNVSKDDPVAGRSREGDLFASDAEVAEDVTAKAAAPTHGSGPPPAADLRPDPGPVLQVLPWSDGLPDRVDRFDSPLSALSSVSTSGVATSSGGPLSLPVQQVAMQLAGVLVQASDRATELALAPEELGKVRLRLEPDAANPDRLTITINVERPETLDLFRRHAGELADAIRAAGYSGADIDFGAQGQGDSGKGQHSGPPSGSELPSDETAPIQHSPRTIAGATLDLRL